MLNNDDPYIEHWGTLNRISCHVLYVSDISDPC